MLAKPGLPSCSSASRPDWYRWRLPTEHGAQLFTKGGQAVFHLWRDLRIDRADNDAVMLQAAELLDEHLLRDADDPALQLREAHRTVAEEMEENDHLPSALQNLQRLFDDARGHRGRFTPTFW